MTPDGLWVMALALTILAAWPISIAYDWFCHATAAFFGWGADRGEEVAVAVEDARMAAAVRRRAS